MRDRHGRWPLAAAGALGPVSALAVRQPAARPLAALLWHQTEEWVWPGWGFSALTACGPAATVPAALLFTSHLGNVGLHVGWAIRHRRYDPGVVTAIATLGPAGVAGLRSLDRDPPVD